mgnify:CR=1 FL=1
MTEAGSCDEATREHDNDGRDPDEAQEVRGLHIVPGRYSAVLLDSGEVSLHHVPLPVQVPVVGHHLFAIAPLWDTRLHPGRTDRGPVDIRVIPLVHQYRLGLDPGDPRGLAPFQPHPWAPWPKHCRPALATSRSNRPR